MLPGSVARMGMTVVAERVRREGVDGMDGVPYPPLREAAAVARMRPSIVRILTMVRNNTTMAMADNRRFPVELATADVQRLLGRCVEVAQTVRRW
jgi:hypothetical protein